MELTVKTKVTGQQIADLLITALEGGSNYWLTGFYLSETTPPNRYVPEPEAGYPWYSDPKLWEHPSGWLILADELSDECQGTIKRHQFGPKQLAEGLQRFAEMRPDTFAAWIAEEYDAGDADVALQIMLLGEVVYG